MLLFYSFYVIVKFHLLLTFEMIRNSLRFTPFGPKKLENLPNIDGKVVIITGSNSGIGKVTAKVLTQLGAKVIFL